MTPNPIHTIPAVRVLCLIDTIDLEAFPGHKNCATVLGDSADNRQPHFCIVRRNHGWTPALLACQVSDRLPVRAIRQRQYPTFGYSLRHHSIDSLDKVWLYCCVDLSARK